MKEIRKKYSRLELTIAALWAIMAILEAIVLVSNMDYYLHSFSNFNNIYKFIRLIVKIVCFAVISILVMIKAKPVKFLIPLCSMAAFLIYPLILDLISLKKISDYSEFYFKNITDIFVLSDVLAVVGGIFYCVLACLRIIPIFVKKKYALILPDVFIIIHFLCEIVPDFYVIFSPYFTTSQQFIFGIGVVGEIISLVANLLLMKFLFEMKEINEYSIKKNIEKEETKTEPSPMRRSILNVLSSGSVLGLGIIILIPVIIDIFGKTPGILSVMYSLGEIGEVLQWIIPGEIEKALRIITIIESLPNIILGLIFISTYSSAKNELVSCDDRNNFGGLKIIRAIFAIDIAFESVKYIVLLAVMGKLSEWLGNKGGLVIIVFIIYAVMVVLFYVKCFTTMNAIINGLENDIDPHDGISSLPRAYAIIKIIILSISALIALFTLNLKPLVRDGLEIVVWYLIAKILGELKSEIDCIHIPDTSPIFSECPSAAQTKTENSPTPQNDELAVSVEISETDDTIVCPNCGCRQNSNRSVCWYCGVKFNKNNN